MAELIFDLFAFLGDTLAGRILQTFLLSLLPIVGLQASLPYSIVHLGLHPLLALAVCVAGNIVPVPFIILFIRKIIDWMKKRSQIFQRLADKLEAKGNKNIGKIQKYQMFGLYLLVSTPLPGSGAWGGSLAAALLNMRLRRAMPTISLGILTSGVIVLIITLGVAAMFSF